MNTKTLAHPGVRFAFVSVLAGIMMLASLFAMPAPKAHAAALTEPQIQAILNLLTAFNVPAATIANVNAILHKSK